METVAIEEQQRHQMLRIENSRLEQVWRDARPQIEDLRYNQMSMSQAGRGAGVRIEGEDHRVRLRGSTGG